MFRVVANAAEWGWLLHLLDVPVRVSELSESEAELVLGLQDRFLVATLNGVSTLTALGRGFVVSAPAVGSAGLRVWAEDREPFDAETTSIGRDRGSLPESC